MSKKRYTPKLLTGAAAAAVERYPLTLEQRNQQRAQLHFRKCRAELREALLLELNQLINGLNLDVELSLCQGSGADSAVESAIAEGERLMLSCPLDSQTAAYMMMDHTASHHLADLCLGGRISAQHGKETELTLTETRIAVRVFHRLLQGTQQLLLGRRSAPLPEVMKQVITPAPYSALVFKVRLLLDNEVISWFMWLPLALFISKNVAEEPEWQRQPLLEDGVWPKLPVRGRVVLAQKTVNVQQLQQLLQGQVLPLPMNEEASFRLGGELLFLGKVAQENDRLAFQVTHNKSK